MSALALAESALLPHFKKWQYSDIRGKKKCIFVQIKGQNKGKTIIAALEVGWLVGWLVGPLVMFVKK